MENPPFPADQLSIPGYRFDSLIGCGGMGCVYRARQESLERDVALKLLQPGPEEGRAKRLERFRNEAHTLATLSHPNIVTVFDRGETDQGPFISMELVVGDTLRDRLKPGLRMKPDAALRILRPEVAALTHIHSHDVLHRDLKPENILFDSAGTPKVADFGLAGLAPELDTAAKSAEWQGSLNYMSPEQRQKLPVDKRSDIFALAVIAYEMLTGELPLGVFEPPSIHDPGLGREVDAAFESALRRDPDERCPSAEEFLRRFEAAVAPKSETADSTPPGRSPLAFAGTLALLALLAAIAFLARTDKSPEPQGPDPVAKTAPELPPSPTKADINQATVVDLMEIEGIGEVLARRIIQERNERQGFRTIDDAMDVPGIGIQRWQALAERFTVPPSNTNGK